MSSIKNRSIDVQLVYWTRDIENQLRNTPQTAATSMADRLLHALLFISFSLLLFISSAVASSDAPFIVAHKKATLKRLKSGAERVLVNIDIYNEGSA